ncbi:hypothetical protein RFI_17489 [Reticulomyxa filosa]|uniref:Uncharacterized protein n=1 Tax=Reticulomyxa filosa TaxID=46433 RepID=X6N354_RETFI|nr:hypothetical protein RFI_17489 [Reticulomyxa filosa]|eukprot:ETO19742.1 hypothetical protein RFI_17489 [Reticulomyxa filosa]
MSFKTADLITKIFYLLPYYNIYTYFSALYVLLTAIVNTTLLSVWCASLRALSQYHYWLCLFFFKKKRAFIVEVFFQFLLLYGCGNNLGNVINPVTVSTISTTILKTKYLKYYAMESIKNNTAKTFIYILISISTCISTAAVVTIFYQNLKKEKNDVPVDLRIRIYTNLSMFFYWLCTLAIFAVVETATEDGYHFSTIYNNLDIKQRAQILIAKNTFVLGSCFLRIIISFRGSVFEYSPRVTWSATGLVALLFLSIIVVLIFAAVNLSESKTLINRQGRDMILITIMYAVIFIVDTFTGALLIFLFVQKLYQVLKVSYKETYIAHTKLALYNTGNVASLSPEIDIETELPRTTVPFKNVEVDLVRMMTKYTLLNSLCISLKTVIETTLGTPQVARGTVSLVALSVLSSFFLSIILWGLYLQTSFGADHYNKYCATCHIGLQNFTASFSKQKIKSEIAAL